MKSFWIVLEDNPKTWYSNFEYQGKNIQDELEVYVTCTWGRWGWRIERDDVKVASSLPIQYSHERFAMHDAEFYIHSEILPLTKLKDILA